MYAAKSLMPPGIGAEAVTLMGRLGYAARAVVYFLVGAAAVSAAIWPEHRPAGPSDAVQLGHGHPVGAIFLIAVAFGLACLAGWFTVAGLTTTRHANARGWWRGLGMLGDAVVYIVFMIDVAGIALGLWHGGGDRNVLVLDRLAGGLAIWTLADRDCRSGRVDLAASGSSSGR